MCDDAISVTFFSLLSHHQWLRGKLNSGPDVCMRWIQKVTHHQPWKTISVPDLSLGECPFKVSFLHCLHFLPLESLFWPPESNFNTDLTLKQRAKVGPRMQTSVSQKSPQSPNPKGSYHIRSKCQTKLYGDFGGFILSMQDFIFLSTPTQWSLCNDCTFQISQIFFGGDQTVRTSNGLKAGFSSLITQIKVKSGFK